MNRKDSNTAYYLDLFGKEEGLVGLMLVSNLHLNMPSLSEKERLVLIIRDGVAPQDEIEQWKHEDMLLRIHRVPPDVLEQWVVTGERSGVQWLVRGEVLFDKNGFLGSLRQRLKQWPVLLREQKLLCEFSRFVQSYMNAKRDLQHGRFLDAYSHVLSALHYWVHVALVEQGMLPELTVWEQIRGVNPGVYKLFEELTTSSESLEKRIQLVVLACEFSMQTRMQTSCALLLHILGSRAAPWTIGELHQDSRLRGLPIDLSLLLQKLVQRGLAKEIVDAKQIGRVTKQELLYTIGGERNSK